MIWDYTYYWGVLSQFFFQRRLTDLASIGRLSVELESFACTERGDPESAAAVVEDQSARQSGSDV